jgi:hypothetical protein
MHAGARDERVDPAGDARPPALTARRHLRRSPPGVRQQHHQFLLGGDIAVEGVGRDAQPARDLRHRHGWEAALDGEVDRHGDDPLHRMRRLRSAPGFGQHSPGEGETRREVRGRGRMSHEHKLPRHHELFIGYTIRSWSLLGERRESTTRSVRRVAVVAVVLSVVQSLVQFVVWARPARSSGARPAVVPLDGRRWSRRQLPADPPPRTRRDHCADTHQIRWSAHGSVAAADRGHGARRRGPDDAPDPDGPGLP